MGRMCIWGIIVLALCLEASVFATENSADPNAILLKNRVFMPEASAVSLAKRSDSRHVILQFSDEPSQKSLNELKRAGIKVLSYVPRNAVVAFVPAGTEPGKIPGIRHLETILPSDKISQNSATSLSKGFVLVDVFADISPAEAKEFIESAGGRVRSNPYLLPNTYLVEADEMVVYELANFDGVSWIWPASDAIIQTKPVHACPGPMTPYGPVSNFVTNGDGWDGPGLGSVDLTYHFINGTPDLVGTSEEAEVVRGLTEWSNYAQINWTQSATAGLNRSLDIQWGAGAHGDAYPFDGPGNVLAHCFYPAPPNSEPIAGDLHFDEDETWRIGSDFDVFSIALHEAGHGLGLNHSASAQAVMYPYYQMVTTLNIDDINGIRALYGARGFISLPEAVDNSSLVLTTGGASNWTGQATTSYFGGDAAQSGDINDSQESWMQTTVMGPGAGSFYWKVSSEPELDMLQFYIDGVLQPGSISGTVDWVKKEFVLPAGSHTLKWRYAKDGLFSSGSDCGWIDKIEWVTNLSEFVDNPALQLTTGGTAGWNGQTSVSYFDGDAAQSGDINDSQDSWMQTTVTGPGTGSFYWKVSSESGWDYLQFYIDSTMQTGSISGTVDWVKKDFVITSGSHTLKWLYRKDNSLSYGSDCGWVDKVEWTPESGSVSVTATDASASEPGTDKGTLRLTRSGSTDAALPVYIQWSGTAGKGPDFSANANPVTIPAGQSGVNVVVTPKDDFSGESNETAILNLIAGAGYTLGSPSSATVTIADDNDANRPLVTCTATDNSASESGGKGFIRISRTGGGSMAGSNISVKFQWTGTANKTTDYSSWSSPKIIPPDPGYIDIPINAKNDALPEATETVILTLVKDAAYNVGVAKSATVNILDNDTVPVTDETGEESEPEPTAAKSWEQYQ